VSSFLPSPEASQQFMNNADKGPVVMLNLLKFKSDGSEEAYGKYTHGVGKIVASYGGRVVYVGRAAEFMVGSEEWEVVAFVQYPTRKALMDLRWRASTNQLVSRRLAL